MTLQAIFLLPASENCQKPSGPRCRGGPTLGTRTIQPGEQKTIFTDLAITPPEGYYIQLMSKSGLTVLYKL